MRWMDAALLFAMLSLAGWLFLMMGLADRRRQRRREEAERARATGTLVEYARREGRSGLVGPWLPVVRFTADGREYALQCDAALDREAFPEGASVEVLYDPDAPERFHLDIEAGRDRGGRLVRAGLIWVAVAAVAVLALSATPAGRLVDFRWLGRQLGPAGNGGAEQRSGDFTYTVFSPANARIDRYTGDAEALELPIVLDGRVVTEISIGAFVRNDTLKSVVVPGTIRAIPAGAFGGCMRLQEVTLLSGVASVGSHAFDFCPRLREVTLPATIEHIADDAFPSDCAATFHVPAGSAAEAWCRKKGYSTEVL